MTYTNKALEAVKIASKNRGMGGGFSIGTFNMQHQQKAGFENLL